MKYDWTSALSYDTLRRQKHTWHIGGGIARRGGGFHASETLSEDPLGF
jgi:hypothetical protein